MNPLKYPVRAAFVAISLLLSSCAATVQNASPTNSPIHVKREGARKIVMMVKGSNIATESADWELLRAEWRTGMSLAAKNAGLGFSYQESEPKAGSDRATAVIVNVNDYRYISPVARYGFGVMTGNAYLDLDVSFSDLTSGKSLGTKKYSTSSTAWQGVFSAMTDKQIAAVCDEIVSEVAKK
jgi:hypothetical protein